jgi:DNA-binding XRE family transcriptional regulator
MKTEVLSEEYIKEKRREVATKLKEARQIKGYTQEELANLMGVARSTIPKIESGSWNPTIDTLILYCYALDLEINFD